MKLRCLQIKNFRCIDDSSEFTVCPVTCLVGKNGAGKTSLLDALHKVNPDVAEMGSFDVLMDYPRSRRRDYQRRAAEQPDDVVIATWELEDKDKAALEKELGPGAVKSTAVVVRKGYYAGRLWSAAIGEGTHVSVPPAPIPEADTHSQNPLDESPTTGTPADEAPVGESPIDGVPAPAPEQPDLKSEINDRASDQSPDHFLEAHLAQRLPKLLYFAEWSIMQGRISIDALLQRKQRGELTGPDRVFLALLQLGGTSPEALTKIERSEELIADLEDAARPITQAIARYWSQEGDLRVSFHLYAGRPQDPAPFDQGLVFETRILNTRTNLSLNFDERSTGFVWFFSFLVWYSDVRRRYGDNLIVLLDDPGLGLHAKAQWDLTRYIYAELAPHHQVLYATHSPFMIDPDRVQWVRTVEDVVQETPDRGLVLLGTKVSEEAMSANYDTLLPLQASLGYRIVQDLAGDRRLLLVEKPADVIYLQWFSATLNEQGRTGLRPDWTITPCGGLTRLATLAGLLAHEPTRFAALLSLSERHPDVVGQPTFARILDRSNVFALHKYAEPMESTIEDLIGPTAYLTLVDAAYGLGRKERLSRTVTVDAGMPLLKTISDYFASDHRVATAFDPTLPAQHLLTGGRKIRKLPGMDEALSRFERLFSDLNARL